MSQTCFIHEYKINFDVEKWEHKDDEALWQIYCCGYMGKYVALAKEYLQIQEFCLRPIVFSF